MRDQELERLKLKLENANLALGVQAHELLLYKRALGLPPEATSQQVIDEINRLKALGYKVN